MKLFGILSQASIAVSVIVTSLIALPALAANHTVVMKSISYDPKVVTVHVGDTVDWQNTSYTPHSATSDDSKTFDTGLIDPKKTTKKIKFEKTGTFVYHCSIHGKSMSGQVEVIQ